MNIRNYIIVILGLALSLSSCNDEKEEKQTNEVTQNIPTNLQLDHLNIWVKNPQKAKERLIEIGFTAVPDSMSEIHHGQGTTGRYFNFLNTYLELIFVYDQNEFEENSMNNSGLDFMERANFESNGASPFSVALKIEDYNLNKIPFETVSYHQEWMGEGNSIRSAKSSKKHLATPSIFVVYPEIEWRTYESLTALQDVPSDDDSWKELWKHPNGAEKLTGISITSKDLELNTEAITAINELENININVGEEHLLELYFDNNLQGKSHDLRPEIPLIIYL